MKSFRKVFSELGKSCLSNCEQVAQLNNFYPCFYQACVFADGQETQYFLCCASDWVFLGFSPEQISD